MDFEKTTYRADVSDVLTALETSEDGLSDDEAHKRLQQFGYNELKKGDSKSVWKMLAEQLTDTMILILLVAAAISFALKEWTEGYVILFIVALNAVISIMQEKKAQNALDSLRQLASPKARVLRDGEEKIIDSRELVPGDVLFLDDGGIVPADVRLIKTSNLKIQEASLTGESLPVEKDADAVFDSEVPLGDRANSAYASSMVMYGNAVGVVVKTGMHTEVGQIADMLDSAKDDSFDTPIKRKLNAVGKTLSIVGILVCVLIFTVGCLYGRPLVPLFMTAISLAISVIPEGLPATATIVMALGVQRMAKKNALMRNLPAVETLGGATVICSDKTGTLTRNKMTVVKAAVCEDFDDDLEISVTDERFADKRYDDLVLCGALCNNSAFDAEREGEVLGDPTEGALLVLARDRNMSYADRDERLFEQPFDSDRKRMSVVYDVNGLTAFTKGAVDEMLPLCSRIQTKDGDREMTDEDRSCILELCEDMSGQALRVLGFAKRSLTAVPQDDDADVENDMTFIGVVGMIDPPRDEVIPAIETCHAAGIKTVMITGDHKITAMAIAKQLGIYRDGNTVVSGEDLDNMSEEELDNAAKTATVFARVSPKEKLKIIESFNRLNEVTAMTGDGVNDAPALKTAAIGVAMGKSGTDVAKDAADMILTDDNFTTIAVAIREGRKVYRNIQKVIQFLLAGNIAEISVLFIATMLNWDAPVLAVHILLINLITDTLPALALGVDPVSKNIMKHKPLKSESLFDNGLVSRVLLHGTYITIATLGAYIYGLRTASYGEAMTMAFCVLAISQMVHALNQRSNTESVFAKSDDGHNFWLFGAMAASAAVMALILFVPAFEQFFKLTDLTPVEWSVVAGCSVLPLAMVEITKFFARRRNKKKDVKKVAVVAKTLRTNKVRVASVLTPRAVCETVPYDMTVAQFASCVAQKHFSRYPVQSADNKDMFVGYVHVLSVFGQKPQKRVAKLATPILEIPSSAYVDVIFDEMLEKRIHMGVVYDELGTWLGIVTFEDLLETLLGKEIADENDKVVDMRFYAKNLWQRRHKQKQAAMQAKQAG